jgi:hypothetical protein
MSAISTLTTFDRVREALLAELSRLRLPRADIERALAAGEDCRIPSRKAIALIARIQRRLGVGMLVKKSDLQPKQITSIGNLIRLLSTKLDERGL